MDVGGRASFGENAIATRSRLLGDGMLADGLRARFVGGVLNGEHGQRGVRRIVDDAKAAGTCVEIANAARLLRSECVCANLTECANLAECANLGECARIYQIICI